MLVNEENPRAIASVLSLVPVGRHGIKRILGESLLISSLQGKALRTLVDIVSLAEIKRILGEWLLISSLTGKALRML